jgi:putative CocE/NonD family hydrolase
MDQLSRTTLETEGGSYFQRWLSNPPWSRYWDPINLSKRVADIKVPALYFGGWYDVFGPATSELFEAVQRNAGSDVARTKSQFIMGPWTHSGKSDIDFGPDASLEIVDLQNQWLDYWLKGDPNGVMSDPAVRVFVTGENHWISSPAWPLTGAEPYQLFLSSKMSAQSRSGDGMLTTTNVPAGHLNNAHDILNADPSHPVPTKGGELCCHGAYPAGAHYQTEIEKRRDVLIYTTPPLGAPLVIVGEPVLTLHIASDAPDADLIAKLIDVSPDQKAWNVADGTLRLRYRGGTERAEWLAKDKIYRVNIRLSALAHTFLVGHSVRLQIAGSDFPNYSINLNSRAGILDGTAGHAARTSIEHSPRFPSSLELPRLAQEAIDPKKKVDKGESLR